MKFRLRSRKFSSSSGDNVLWKNFAVARSRIIDSYSTRGFFPLQEIEVKVERRKIVNVSFVHFKTTNTVREEIEIKPAQQRRRA